METMMKMSKTHIHIFLENEVIKKLMLSNNVNNKKCTPKLIFFNEKQIENDSD